MKLKAAIIAVFGLGILLVVQETAFAQGGASAVPFLLISPNSRASGMGEAGAGLADDAGSVYWNPGGLGFLKGSEVSITHSNWLPQFHLADLFYDYLNYRQDVPEWGGTVAGSVTYLNLGEFTITDETGPIPKGSFKAFEVAATVGYGAAITDTWGLGMNLRFINSALSPMGTGQEQGTGIAYDMSFDIATLWKPKTLVIPFTDLDLGEHFQIGANLSNIGPKITYIDAAQADPLPTTLRLGFGIIPVKDEFNSLEIALDFSRLLVNREGAQSDPLPKSLITSWTSPGWNGVLRSTQTSVGMEYWYNKLIALRMGYFYEDPAYGDRKFMTFGAGIRYDIYGFDFSYDSTSDENSPLSDTLRFTLLIIWGGGD
ncbi:MAG TPA: PorV/PorQ family protein [Bacteroidota bacterium]|nr:PorV/PorQ family protein [Bacteroidota bacterium]